MLIWTSYCFRLTVIEVEFLQEYSKTMKPLSKALDIIQSEQNSFIGFELPILHELHKKIKKV